MTPLSGLSPVDTGLAACITLSGVSLLLQHLWEVYWKPLRAFTSMGKGWGILPSLTCADTCVPKKQHHSKGRLFLYFSLLLQKGPPRSSREATTFLEKGARHPSEALLLLQTLLHNSGIIVLPSFHPCRVDARPWLMPWCHLMAGYIWRTKDTSRLFLRRLEDGSWMIYKRSPWHCKCSPGAQSNSKGGRGMTKKLSEKPRGEKSPNKTPWGKKFGCLCLERVNRSSSWEKELWFLSGCFLLLVSLGQVLLQWFVSKFPSCTSRGCSVPHTGHPLAGAPRSPLGLCPQLAEPAWQQHWGAAGTGSWCFLPPCPATPAGHTSEEFIRWCCTSAVTESLVSMGIVFPVIPIQEYSSTGNEFLSLGVHPLSPVLGLKTAARMKDLKSCVRHRSRKGWTCMDISPSLWLATSNNWDWSCETPQRPWIWYCLIKAWKDDATGSPEAKIWACKKPIKRT